MILPTEPEIRVPFSLAWALYEMGTCPSCLGALRADLCVRCEMDFAGLVTFAELRAEAQEYLR